jgi:hypothetical protein
MSTRTLTRPAPDVRAGLILAAILAISAAACSNGGAGATPAATPSPIASSSGAPSSGPDASKELPMPPSSSPATGDGVPQAIIDTAVSDAANRAGVDAGAVTVVTAQAVNWPNGAAGCPKLGMMYTEVITPGYHVVLRAGTTTYDYRGSRRAGTLSLCENPPGQG